MDGSLDIITLVFLLLAVVVIFKLRSVLGRRTGNERPFPPREVGRAEPATASQDKVVPLPRPEMAVRTGEATGKPDVEQRMREFMPDTNPAWSGLVEVARNDPEFDPKRFMAGAKTAYEMIVTAFAEGNRKLLKQLLGRDVLDGFLTAISEREGRGETVESSFVGINKADVIEAELRNKIARISVKFVSQLITAVRNRAGEVVEGDPKQIREVTDIWTFARDVTSRDPNWKLVATETAN